MNDSLPVYDCDLCYMMMFIVTEMPRPLALPQHFALVDDKELAPLQELIEQFRLSSRLGGL